MADDVVFMPANHRHFSQVEKWSARNDAVKTLLKTPRDPSSGSKPSSWHWVAVRDDEAVSIATVELSKEHVGYINCVVKPGYQRQGIGSQLFEYVLARPDIEKLIHLHALVEPANTAAQKILNSHGFSRVGYDAHGRIEFARHGVHK